MRKKSFLQYHDRTITYSDQQKFIINIFLWMSVGLSLTAFVSYWFASNSYLMNLLIANDDITFLGYIVTFSPIIFVLLMSFGFQKISYPILLILFVIYSGIMGISLSFIFLIYTTESIYSTFLIAAVMFGSMGVAGYLTKIDLSKIGSILLMTLIGVSIATLINIFFRSDKLSFIISVISIILFSILTAFDIQKMKTLSENCGVDEEEKNKLGVLGALTLYLDFINLFLSLLRFFGKRRK